MDVKLFWTVIGCGSFMASLVTGMISIGQSVGSQFVGQAVKLVHPSVGFSICQN